MARQMPITVLYRESGSGCEEIPMRVGTGAPREDAGYNAFELFLPQGKTVATVSDLVGAFPLGPSYHLDVLRPDGIFESVRDLDLGSPVPFAGGNIITCRVFRLACPPGYASGGTGKMLPVSATGVWTGPGRGSQQQQQQQYHRKQSAGGGGGGGGNVVKDLKKNAGKATKGLFGLVSGAVQRTAEYLTHQEMTVGVYKVQIVREMAEGAGFSTVYLVRDARTREHLALKRMLCQERNSTEAAHREVQVLRAVAHRNVIALLDQVSMPSKTHPGAREFLLLFPYYERGTVWDAIVKASENGPPWPYPEPSALRVFLDACCGVNAMHSHGYAHRDMKPLNLLVGDDGSCVVMDVGSACPARREVSTRKEALLLEDEASVVCSAPYRPPELTTVEPGAVIDERVDVWALGCTLYAMAFGHSPFESPREGVMKLAILNGKFSFPRGRRGPLGQEYSTGFCELIGWMLTADPASRPRCPEIIKRIQELITRR
ncbi:unnamed protein product [Ectocarpus sp. 12 AP-2014]